MQLVEDGNAVAGHYLKYASNTTQAYSIRTAETENGILDLMIKENVDGSAILTINGKYFLSVNNNTVGEKVTIKEELSRYVRTNEIFATSNATDIKTYNAIVILFK